MDKHAFFLNVINSLLFYLTYVLVMIYTSPAEPSVIPAKAGILYFFLNHTLKGVVIVFFLPSVIPAFTKYCVAQAGI